MSSLSHLVISEHFKFLASIINIITLYESSTILYYIFISTQKSFGHCISSLPGTFYLFYFSIQNSIGRFIDVSPLCWSRWLQKYFVSGAASEVPVTVVLCLAYGGGGGGTMPGQSSARFSREMLMSYTTELIPSGEVWKHFHSNF